MIPNHVAIIMDGNGRWARQRGKNRLMGHAKGRDSVYEAAVFALENGIKYLSLYAFSEENWNRPQEEVSGLMKLMMKAMADERHFFMEHSVRFLAIGNRSRLAPELLEQIERLENETASHTALTMAIMISYSGKWDIMQAAEKYARAVMESGFTALDMETFDSYLATAELPDPDLLIRTGGEQRISNFMLWQSAYTELYFTETLWPDFRKCEFQKALDSFKNRERRYGKIK
ncbi:MAG: di-trans,poly-cis-decaprenylcistransferase [Bacteroidales bacterium]|nr:di-trans,poly-cis-decaprenylcistransferase [Bacteroidales bacterium]